MTDRNHRADVPRPSVAPCSRAASRSAVLARNNAWPLVLAVFVSLGSGCHLGEWRQNGFKVGPNYGRPETAVADQWIDYQDPRVASDERQLAAWWEVFNDPILNQLASEAREQNLTLRAAGARVLEAQATRRFAAGSLFPQVQEVTGSFTRDKISETNPFVPPATWFDQWNLGAQLNWELDFWGRYRRAIESADAELDASIENYDDVLVVLLAEVGSSYVELRTFQQRLAYARQNVEIQEKSYQLAQDKFNAGATTERDVQQSRQVLEETRAAIPQYEAGIRRTSNALCALLGMSPRDLLPRLGEQGEIPKAPAQITMGIPADLLRRRPDVRRAERFVAAQSARIGIAEAEFYPHIHIVGSLGFQSEQFADLFRSPESLVGAVGPGFRWNILHYGRLLANVDRQDAKFQELAYEYQQSVVRAGREAEDALISYMKEQERAERLAESVDAAQRALEITNDQYRLGAVDFTPVFLFQSTLANQQDRYAVAQGNISLALVQLYRALGGGWQSRLEYSVGDE